jgi:hypothetical protein
MRPTNFKNTNNLFKQTFLMHLIYVLCKICVVLGSYQSVNRYGRRRVPFSCFALLDSFSAVPRRRVRFSCYALQDSVSAIPRASGSVFMFALPDSFSAVPRASGPVFMFCALGLIFGGTEGVGSCFHVLRSRTRFRWYRRRMVMFSCFALPDPFLLVPTAYGHVFMFCAPGLIFSGTEGVRCGFHVLRSRTRIRRYRGRRVPFSSFSLPDPFSAVPTVMDPVFMFCAPRLIFDGTDGVGSRFLVLRSWTYFGRYRWRRVPFLCFALPDTFSTVPMASGFVFMFCDPGPVFGGTEASGPVIMFCAPGLIFGGTEGVGCGFHVLPSRTRFRRYRGR